MPSPPVRSASAQALTDSTLITFPGMTIFWIGDLTHQGEVSGHNPDDYPPLQAELTDADSKPEVRANDFMIGPKFTAASAQRFVTALITGPDKNRIYYVIYNRTIYRRATGFKPEHYDGGDPHTNHVHVSGWVGDDENRTAYRSVLALRPMEEDEDMKVYHSPAGYFISNGVNRRKLSGKGSIFGPATSGYPVVELTDAQRIASGLPTWDEYLDAVAGPLHGPVESVMITGTLSGTISGTANPVTG